MACNTTKCAAPDCNVKMKKCKMVGNLCPACAAKQKQNKKP